MAGSSGPTGFEPGMFKHDDDTSSTHSKDKKEKEKDKEKKKDESGDGPSKVRRICSRMG